VKEVPLDAFWSVTLYDDKSWLPVNDYNAYSFNEVTAEKDPDGVVSCTSAAILSSPISCRLSQAGTTS